MVRDLSERMNMPVSDDNDKNIGIILHDLEAERQRRKHAEREVERLKKDIREDNDLKHAKLYVWKPVQFICCTVLIKPFLYAIAGRLQQKCKQEK